MARTHFTAEIRVLLCEACGAPLEAPVGGGAIHCTYCRVQNQVSTRDERPTLGMPAVAAPIDEAERMRRLRSQDHQPLVPPAGILYLLAGSTFDPAKVEEASHVYQATRKEVRATSSPDAAERLYFLTLVANNYYGQANDPERRRAILETSLDTLFLPRHKQVLRCELARAAAKEGDAAAAERWISPCNPRSDDLQSDSAFRLARSYIDTCRHDWRAVIAVLGGEDEAVPIDDSRDAICAVLRANALERAGDVPAAIRALATRMGRESAEGRHAIEAFVRSAPELALCPVSLPQALAQHSAVAAKAAEAGAGGGIGTIFFFVGIGILGLGVVMGLAGFVPIVVAGFSFTHDVGALLGVLGGAVGAGVVMAIGPLIMGGVFTAVGHVLRKGAKNASFLRQHGVRARGRVLGMEPTGTTINDVPMMRVRVTVLRDDAAPYESAFSQLMQPHVAAHLAIGREVPLRVHPTKPDEIMLEML